MTLTSPEVDERPLPADAPPATTPIALRRPNLLATSLVVGTYLVLAVLANWHAWTTGAARTLEITQDPKLNAWTLAWTPFALSHGVDPLFSHWVNVPFGANYAANVAIPLLALIVSPVTAVWGPVAATNFVISFSFFASAVTGYFFVRHWTTWRPAAFFGGLLFGFSPYVVAEGSAHIHTMFVAFVPLIFIVLDEIIVRQRYSSRVLGLLLGLLVIAQYFVSTEVLVSTAVLALIALLFVVFCNRDRVRDHLLLAVRAVGTALVLVAVVLAYPVWYSIRGPEHYTLVIPSGHYQADFLGALLPTSNQLISPTSAAAISDRFANNLSENAAYIGIPLLLLLLGTVVVCRRSKVTVVGFMLTLSAYTLSLGSPLLVDNHDTGFPMPGAIFHHLPLLTGAVPARFDLFVFLFAALVMGIGLERLRGWNWWPTSWSGLTASVGVAVTALVPLLPNLPYSQVLVDTPSFFTTEAVDTVPPGSVAVVYPAASTTDADAMLWQASAAMRFKMPGAYALVPTAGTGQSEWGTQTFTIGTLNAIESGLSVAETPSIRNTLRTQWRAWNVQTFIMGPGNNESTARRFVSWVIGRSPVSRQGVYIWYGVERYVRTARHHELVK